MLDLLAGRPTERTGLRWSARSRCRSRPNPWPGRASSSPAVAGPPRPHRPAQPLAAHDGPARDWGSTRDGPAHPCIRRRHRRRRHGAERGVPPGAARASGTWCSSSKDELGSGSTCKAAGGVRAQFSDAGQHRARAAQPADLRARSARSSARRSTCTRSATCSCSTGPSTSRPFEKNVALQNELGVPSRMIDVAEAKRLSPLIDTEGLLAAAYSPTDGHCTPESVVLGYATAARRAGARLLRRTARSTGSSVDGGDDRGGAYRRGARSRPTPSSAPPAPGRREVGAMAGVDLPVDAAAPADPRHRADAGPGPGARRSPSTSRPASTSTARGAGCCWACPTPTRRPASSSARPTTGCRGSARPSSGGRRARRRRHRRRLGRALRDDARPQRADRRGRRGVAGSSTPPASPATAS